jgi:molybdopterin-guanine dinucleotide biosynthesis protein MobB
VTLTRPKLIGIVGRSKSGKTTLLEHLVAALTADGYRVGTIKHARGGFEMDRQGSDSQRHFQAGACTVVVVSEKQGQLALVTRIEQEPAPEEIVRRYFADTDIVLTEGFMRSDIPKILLVPSNGDATGTKDVKNVVAIVGPPEHTGGVPCFDRDDIDSITSFVKDIVDQGLTR